MPTLQKPSTTVSSSSVAQVHRDLKPENIMLRRHGGPPDIRVIDFGLSCIYTADGQHALHRLAGTPYYMAPEVISRAAGGYGAACDVWSCGVVLYFRRADISPTNRDRWLFRGDESRRRRGRDVDIPWRHADADIPSNPAQTSGTSSSPAGRRLPETTTRTSRRAGSADGRWTWKSSPRRF